MKKLLVFLRENNIETEIHKSSFLTGARDHRKIMVIDGEIAFTGGMNIGEHYQNEWHDQQTLIMGPAVAALQDTFISQWKHCGGTIDSMAGL